MSFSIRSLRRGDDAIVRWVLREAIAWNQSGGPRREDAIHDPVLDRYHRGWGRPGDFGVVAESAGAIVGAACARLHTASDHGFGFVDDQTPELGVAVDATVRRQGVGTCLMQALADEARSLGYVRLSLSVENSNPARDLYVQLGYRTVADDGQSSVMVASL